MSKKKVLVTGSSQGIGLSIAKKLKEDGFDVIIHASLKSEANLETVAKENGFFFKAFDLSQDPTSFCKEIFKEYGALYALVNNAGVMADQNFYEDSYSSICNLFKINALAPFVLSREFLKTVDKSIGGRLINISSNAVKYGMGRNQTIQYTSSKMALEALTEGLYRIGADKNVLVNTLRPGIVETRMQIGRENLQDRVNMIPLKKMASTKDIANLVSFLVSDKAGHITGQTISVAGGE